MSIRSINISLAAACAFILSGCSPLERAPELSGRLISIKKTSVYNFGDIRMGLGWVRKTSYTSEDGSQRTGLVAELDILEPGDPPKESHVSAHAGQTFNAGKHSLYVEELRGGDDGHVKLRLLSDDTP